MAPAGTSGLWYCPDELPQYTSSVCIASYDEQGWTQLSPADMAMTSKSTANTFAAMSEIVVPFAPNFQLSNLVIEPGEAYTDEEITINVTVTNIINTAGNCTLKLKIDGKIRGIKSAAVGPVESQVVSFTITETLKGMHIVEVVDLEDRFSIVEVYRPWWLFSLALGGLVAWLERRRRWHQRVNWSTGLKTNDWLTK